MSQEAPTLASTEQSDRRPRVWSVYLLFVLALLTTSAVTLGVIGFTYASSHPGQAPSRLEMMQHALTPSIFTLTILSSAVILCGASVAAAAFSAVPWRKRLNLQRGRQSVLAVTVGAVGLLALSMVLENVTLLLGVKISGTLEMIAGSIGAARGMERLFIVLAISLGPGLGEELLFRGYIQTRLEKRHAAPVAIIVTSVLFGLMHMDPLQSTLTTFMGVYLGFLVHRFRSLWPGVYAHALNNGVSALFLTFGGQEQAPAEPSYVALLLGVVLFSGSVVLVLRRTRGAVR